VEQKRIQQKRTTDELSRGRKKDIKTKDLNPKGKGTPPGQRERHQLEPLRLLQV
jgi:hypothetical protein